MTNLRITREATVEPRLEMEPEPTHAVILAAGTGTRLGSFGRKQPKGLIRLDDETLVERSIRMLEAAGVTRVRIVCGFMASYYREAFSSHKNVDLIVNPRFADSGSVVSLALALQDLSEGTLILESDIAYEPRALEATLRSSAVTCVLASGPTGSGDEVWVDSAGSRLRILTKDSSAVTNPVGEFVGITRLSALAVNQLCDVATHIGSTRPGSHYEDAVNRLAQVHPIGVELVPDLRWGEVDTLAHLERVYGLFLPKGG